MEIMKTGDRVRLTPGGRLAMHKKGSHYHMHESRSCYGVVEARLTHTYPVSWYVRWKPTERLSVYLEHHLEILMLA